MSDYLHIYRLFQALLDLGASPNSRDENGLTPLYLCVSSNDEFDADCVEMLLRDYAQHEIVDAAGSTELHHVCRRNTCECSAYNNSKFIFMSTPTAGLQNIKIGNRL